MVGDMIIAATAKSLEPVRHSEIVSIEVDRQARDSISVGETLQFGVKVTFHANEGYDYYVLPAPDRMTLVQAEANAVEQPPQVSPQPE